MKPVNIKPARQVINKANMDRAEQKARAKNYRPISPFMIDELKTRFVAPPAPTYETKTVSGQAEYHPITKRLVDEHAVSAEDEAKFMVWAESVEELQRSFNKELLDMLLLEGIPAGYDEAAYKEWQDKRAYYKFPAFNNAFEERIAYIKQVMFPDPVQLLEIVADIMSTIPGANRDEVRIARESFRGLMEG